MNKRVPTPVLEWDVSLALTGLLRVTGYHGYRGGSLLIAFSSAGLL